MATWIVLLRGINVGGRNTISMKDLVATLGRAGYRAVQTYIQSGNLVLESAKRSARAVADDVANELRLHHDVEAAVLALSPDELTEAIRSNPFQQATGDPRSLHLILLEGEPSADGIDALNRLKSSSESFVINGRLLYLHAPEGIGRSRFVSGFESALGIAGTGRNWRTVLKLAELAGDAG